MTVRHCVIGAGPRSRAVSLCGQVLKSLVRTRMVANLVLCIFSIVISSEFVGSWWFWPILCRTIVFHLGTWIVCTTYIHYRLRSYGTLLSPPSTWFAAVPGVFLHWHQRVSWFLPSNSSFVVVLYPTGIYFYFILVRSLFCLILCFYCMMVLEF